MPSLLAMKIARNLGLALAVGAFCSALEHVVKYTCSKKKRVIGIIPARYDSVRFPGKPLETILGKPMILHTYEAACKANLLDEVVVATDDERIANICREAGAKVVLTSSSCANGSERCAEAYSKLLSNKDTASKYDIVVNIQGDEPLIDPTVIDSVVQALQNSPDAVYSTACAPMHQLEDVALRQRVKCITDVNGYALYFSRGAIPHNKEGQAKEFPSPFSEQGKYLMHLGVQCFDAEFLVSKYTSLAPTPLMVMEDLEQLKILEHGYRMKVVVVNDACHGVDTPEDLVSVEAMMMAQKQHEYAGIAA